MIHKSMKTQIADQHDWFIRSARNESGFEDFYMWRNCDASFINNQWVITRYPNNWVKN